MSRVKGIRKGYGMPIVIVKNSYGKNIYSTDKGLQHPWAFNATDLALSLTNFQYTYIDDDEDECTLTFETQSSKLADHPDLQESKEISVTWGYIEGSRVSRVLRIHRIKTRYMNDKIVVDIMCHDLASAISRIKTKDNKLQNKEADEINSFVGWYKATFGGSRFKFKVIQNGVEVVGRQALSGIARGTTSSYGLDVRLVKKNGDEDIPIMDFLKSIQAADDGRSVKETIEDSVDSMPGGPWYIDTRDDDIVIHNRTTSFENDPVRYYNYRAEDGDILSMVTDIRDKVEKIAASNGSTVDDESKESTYTNQHNANNSAGDLKNVASIDFENMARTKHVVINDPTGLTGEEMEALRAAAETRDTEAFDREIAKIYVERLFERYQTDKELTKTTLNLPTISVATRETGPGYEEVQITENGESRKYVLPNDQPAKTAYNSGAGGGVRTGAYTTAIPTSFVSYINLPLAESLLKQKVINMVRGKEQLSRTADITLIGDPLLEGRKIIYIGGIAKVHAGKHYIKRCRHQISQSNGYTTTCETYQESKAIQDLLAIFRGEKITRDGKGEGNTKDADTYKLADTQYDLWTNQRALDAAKENVEERARRLATDRKVYDGLKNEYDSLVAEKSPLVKPGESFESWWKRRYDAETEWFSKSGGYEAAADPRYTSIPAGTGGVSPGGLGVVPNPYNNAVVTPNYTGPADLRFVPPSQDVNFGL